MTLQERIENISAVLDKNKAENIEVFDLKDSDYMSDAVIIASALSKRHTEALLDYMKKELKPQEEFLHTDISEEWIVVDLGDILVHIMTPEYRNKYDIESFLSQLKSKNEQH